MNETSIQVAPSPGSQAVSPVPPTRVAADRLRWVKLVLRPLASLRLTVFLFALCMFLVFCGTLAMRDNGLWATLHGYFRTPLAWIPFQVFVPFGQVFFGLPQTLRVPGTFPFPGGWVLGGALLLNLLAAHVVRFKIVVLKRAAGQLDFSSPTLIHGFVHFLRYRVDWMQTLGKRSGILLIHGGLIVMLLGELITGLFADEGLMPIKIGESNNYTQNTERVELAFVRNDPQQPNQEQVIVAGDALLRKGGTFDDERLPYKIEIVRFLPNTSGLRELISGERTVATRGDGLEVTVDQEELVSGSDTSNRTNTPGAFVTLRDKKTSASLGTYLVWVYLGEQAVGTANEGHRMALRYERSYQPYRIFLEEFHHDTYPGTNIPKNFSSRVRLLPEQGASREVNISMNSPMRYEGQTFYQSGTLDADSGTVLQVVHNPGASLPYISCALVCLGMLVHFGLHLTTFLQRRTA